MMGMDVIGLELMIKYMPKVINVVGVYMYIYVYLCVGVHVFFPCVC